MNNHDNYWSHRKIDATDNRLRECWVITLMKKYMVVEKYKEGCFEKIYQRYHSRGRCFQMVYVFFNSLVNKDKNICFQLMETNDEQLFFKWFEQWKDLVDFELYPID